MKVKICANKNVYDAQSCIDAKADIIGVLVGKKHNSNDFIDKETAKEIVDYVNKRCEVSLVTHLVCADEIIELINYIGIDIIQLHSNIDENEVYKIKQNCPKVKLVRVIHISKDGKIYTDIKKIKYADYYLLDSFNLITNQVGGTGEIHNWDKSAEIIRKLNKPTFLAGGLNLENVITAIKTTKPYGVDVNSGCKNEKGTKDRNKVVEFVKKSKYLK